VDLSEPIFLGMDLPALVTLPAMIVIFAFAVWFGATRAERGIDAEEQARRMEESGRS
jgi:hypothetical protein